MKIKFHDLIKSLLFITVLTIFSSCNVGWHQGFSSNDGSLVLTIDSRELKTKSKNLSFAKN